MEFSWQIVPVILYCWFAWKDTGRIVGQDEFSNCDETGPDENQIDEIKRCKLVRVILYTFCPKRLTALISPRSRATLQDH